MFAGDYSRPSWHGMVGEVGAPGSLPDKPVNAFQGADMMNLFLIVDVGDHHVTVLGRNVALASTTVGGLSIRPHPTASLRPPGRPRPGYGSRPSL